ncbi:hypothetical protein F5146DRAFT_1001706 [Armillaria mellea]|nr:hypothetical protein F5146DRAFT_1001706 [Armillaria mellea]
MPMLTLFHLKKNTSKSPTGADIVISMKASCKSPDWLQAGWKLALLDWDQASWLVKCIEEGAQMVSYKDQRLVYSAFEKMQAHHIYFLNGHDMDPTAILIVDNKVRFVDMALKRWFSLNIVIYDWNIHDGLQLKQACRKGTGKDPVKHKYPLMQLAT